MAFDEKGFLATLTSKTSAAALTWEPGVEGATNPPTLFTTKFKDYRADVVQVGEDKQIWVYDSENRLAEIPIDDKILPAVEGKAVPVEAKPVEVVPTTGEKEAVLAVVASTLAEYDGKEEVVEEVEVKG